MSTFTIIDDGRKIEVDATIAPDGVRIAPSVLRSTLGWELKPEGLCKDAVCIPVTARESLSDNRGVDLESFAAAVGRPLAIEPESRCAVLAEAAADRWDRLATLEAPEFTLPDLHGRPHSLRDYRGKKVLLVAYASW